MGTGFRDFTFGVGDGHVQGSDWAEPLNDHYDFRKTRPSGWGQEVGIMANREDEEPWRLDRLRGLAHWLNDNDPSNIRFNIDNLNDHKGCLTVAWAQKPSEEEEAFVCRGWDTSEYQVEHHWPGHPTTSEPVLGGRVAEAEGTCL